MIAEILLEGADNAKTGREICATLDIKPRDLTAAVEHERRNGEPICASTGDHPGYYLAANKEEMQAFCKSLQHRAGEIHKTRKACLETIKELPAREADKDADTEGEAKEGV